MNKKSSRRWDIRRPDSMSNFWTKGLCPFRVFEDREPPAQAFLEASGSLTDWTPRAGVGCPLSLAHLAARLWLPRGTKKNAPAGGQRRGTLAGVSSVASD